MGKSRVSIRELDAFKRSEQLMHRWLQKPLFVCCTLSVALWGVVIGVDFLSGDKIWINRKEVSQLEREGRIESITRRGNEFTIYFTEFINLQRGNNLHVTDSVFVKAVDVSEGLKFYWSEDGRLKEQNQYKEDMNGDWIIVLCFLFGVAFAIYSALRNAREGSPRYKVMEIEKKYRNGQMSDAEFKRQIDELSPYL